MYTLNPPAVFAHESVVADARNRRRLERVIGALAEPREPVIYTDADLPGLLQSGRIPAAPPAMGTLARIDDPVLLFNTFRFDEHRAARIERLRAGGGPTPGGHRLNALIGGGPFDWFDDRPPARPEHNSRICRACWRIHFQSGCAHKCHYCALGGLLTTIVNVEEYIAHLDALIEAHPWQETYLLEDDADVLCLEPELDCLGPIIEYFGSLTGRYLIIHTKSANVDWMTDLKHNGNTILVWSLAGWEQTSRLEPATADLTQRVAAARTCQAAGYPIRYKFKPIIPVLSWREDADEAVRLALEQTNPDVISLCVFMWTDIDAVKQKLHHAALEPAFIAAAEAAAEELAGVNARPFPHEVRAAIYDHYIRRIRLLDSEVPVSLSTETFGMWKQFGGALGAGPYTYVCGCGPNSTPGRRKLQVHPYRTAHKAPGTTFEQL